MIIDDLIFDRSQADLSGNTPKAYHNVSDLVRIGAACQYISDMFNQAGISNAISVKSSWGVLDYTPENLNQVLQNIMTLRNKGFFLPATPEVPENFNRPTLEMANDLERILHDIYMAFMQAQ
jgi:hypothetical protein